METQCHQCGYEWDYNGGKTTTATCPDCKNTTPLEDEQAGADANESNGGDGSGGTQAGGSNANQGNQQAMLVRHPLTNEQEPVGDALDDVVELLYEEHNSVAERVGDNSDRLSELEEQTDDHREMLIELTEAVEALASHQHDLAEGEPTDGQTVTLEKDLRD